MRAIYLDVAPYMRSRISPQKNYAAGVKPGDVMLGGGIGEVVQRALNLYTVEQLAAIDGQELKNLGPGGRELKNQVNRVHRADEGESAGNDAARR